MESLCPACLIAASGAKEAPGMFDVFLAVVGTGGILVMAAYAALCERI
jgi:hypothetical protein